MFFGLEAIRHVKKTMQFPRDLCLETDLNRLPSRLLHSFVDSRRTKGNFVEGKTTTFAKVSAAAISPLG